MSREEHIARQLCRALDRSMDDIDPVVLERLRATRERALRHRATAREPVAAMVGADGTAILGPRDDDGTHPFRTALIILALLASVSIAYVWNGFAQVDANEEIDIALLSDDLPPDAYIDPGFQAWLSHYTQESVR